MRLYVYYTALILAAVAVNTLARRLLKRRWNLWLGYGAFAAGTGAFIWSVSQPDTLFNDFYKAYYPVGRVLLQDPSGFYEKACAAGFLSHGFSFANLPIVALLLSPLSLLDRQAAGLLFAGIGGLAALTAAYVLVQRTGVAGWRRMALLGLFAVNGPLYYSLREGNSTHLVFLVLLVALICLESSREFRGGSLLAAVAWIKLPLFLFGAYLLLRKRWRALAGFGAAALGIPAASLLLFGPDLHRAWYELCIRPNTGNPVAAYNVQSVDGFLARLVTSGNLLNWDPLELGPGFKLTASFAVAAMAGAALWICWRARPPTSPEERKLEFSIVLCLSLVASPISWTHYYLYLLLPFALYLGNGLAIPGRWDWFSAIVLCAYLTSLPVIEADPRNPVLNWFFSKLFISHYFFGGMLFLAVLLAARRHSRQ
jgi:hypothetical protein